MKPKWNRRQVGSVTERKEEDQRFKGKGTEDDPFIKEFSIKITEDITLRKGDYLNLENKPLKLASLKASKDKMSEETYEAALERINKMPDFVKFEIIKVSKES